MSELIKRRTLLTTAASAAALATALPLRAIAESTTHTVEMLNKHPDDPKLRQVFVPRIVVVKPGDTVTFTATDRSHNSASSKGMIPEGAEAWKGKINEEISVTFEVPGFYGYNCTPHASVGMVGLVIVEGEGMMDNFEDAKGVRQRGKARGVWEEIWAEVDGMELMTS